MNKSSKALQEAIKLLRELKDAPNDEHVALRAPKKLMTLFDDIAQARYQQKRGARTKLIRELIERLVLGELELQPR